MRLSHNMQTEDNKQKKILKNLVLHFFSSVPSCEHFLRGSLSYERRAAESIPTPELCTTMSSFQIQMTACTWRKQKIGITCYGSLWLVMACYATRFRNSPCFLPFTQKISHQQNYVPPNEEDITTNQACIRTT